MACFKFDTRRLLWTKEELKEKDTKFIFIWRYFFIMAEKKPIQPLLLFCLIAMLSFCTGVFVGNMLTLHFMEESPGGLDTGNLEILSAEEDAVTAEELSQEPVENPKKEK